MIHSVRLSQPPANFQPPEDLRNRFWYDDTRQRLCFDGFMSKATFDRLKPLDQNCHYQRAIDELFRICVPEEQVRGAANVGVVVSALFGLAALSGLLLFVMIR
jgi:hypothetical protein